MRFWSIKVSFFLILYSSCFNILISWKVDFCERLYLNAWFKREEMSIPMEYTHGTKWVLINPLDTCFNGEFQVELDWRMFNLVCSVWKLKDDNI